MKTRYISKVFGTAALTTAIDQKKIPITEITTGNIGEPASRWNRAIGIASTKQIKKIGYASALDQQALSDDCKLITEVTKFAFTVEDNKELFYTGTLPTGHVVALYPPMDEKPWEQFKKDQLQGHFCIVPKESMELLGATPGMNRLDLTKGVIGKLGSPTIKDAIAVPTVKESSQQPYVVPLLILGTNGDWCVIADKQTIKNFESVPAPRLLTKAQAAAMVYHAACDISPESKDPVALDSINSESVKAAFKKILPNRGCGTQDDKSQVSIAYTAACSKIIQEIYEKNTLILDKDLQNNILIGGGISEEKASVKTLTDAINKIFSGSAYGVIHSEDADTYTLVGGRNLIENVKQLATAEYDIDNWIVHVGGVILGLPPLKPPIVVMALEGRMKNIYAYLQSNKIIPEVIEFKGSVNHTSKKYALALPGLYVKDMYEHFYSLVKTNGIPLSETVYTTLTTLSMKERVQICDVPIEGQNGKFEFKRFVIFNDADRAEIAKVLVSQIPVPYSHRAAIELVAKAAAAKEEKECKAKTFKDFCSYLEIKVAYEASLFSAISEGTAPILTDIGPNDLKLLNVQAKQCVLITKPMLDFINRNAKDNKGDLTPFTNYREIDGEYLVLSEELHDYYNRSIPAECRSQVDPKVILQNPYIRKADGLVMDFSEIKEKEKGKCFDKPNELVAKHILDWRTRSGYISMVAKPLEELGTVAVRISSLSGPEQVKRFTIPSSSSTTSTTGNSSSSSSSMWSSNSATIKYSSSSSSSSSSTSDSSKFSSSTSESSGSTMSLTGS